MKRKIIAAQIAPKIGVTIVFESLENVYIDDYFRITLSEKNHDFKVTHITIDGGLLRVTATEVGYYLNRFNNNKTSFDLRDLFDIEVIEITDKEEKDRIYERTCYC